MKLARLAEAVGMDAGAWGEEAVPWNAPNTLPGATLR